MAKTTKTWTLDWEHVFECGNVWRHKKMTKSEISRLEKQYGRLIRVTNWAK